MAKTIVTGYIGDYLFWNNFNFTCVAYLHDGDQTPQKHDHKDFLELVIVRSGNAVHEVNDYSSNISAGQVFLLSPGDVHCYKNPQNFYIYNILFDEYFMHYLQPDIVVTPGYQMLFNADYSDKNAALRPNLFIRQEMFPEVMRLLENMITAEKKKFPGAQTKIISDFLQLIFIISTNVTVNNENSGYHLYNISRLAAHLETTFDQPWTLEKMAQYAKIPVSNFRQLFTKIMGDPPIRYLLNLRLQKSTDLLIAKNISISETAYLCGFNDLNYFSRQFKNYFSYSPSEYLKKYKYQKPEINR